MQAYENKDAERARRSVPEIQEFFSAHPATQYVNHAPAGEYYTAIQVARLANCAIRGGVMARIQLTLISGEHDWVRPLFDGTVQPEGVDLIVTRSPPPEAMRRQLSTWEFDISEMAFGAYLVARAKGVDIVAIPAFPMRGFFHTNFSCHADANIKHPGDLVNKRVGIAEYVQSACLWARGILQHDFGMDPSQVRW